MLKIMRDKEINITLIITTKNVYDKAVTNHFIVNGIEKINDKLLFNGEEAIYVHLKEPIEDVEIEKILYHRCKKLSIKDRFVMQRTN